MTHSFKSYVDLDEHELSELDFPPEDQVQFEPRLLPGEVVVAEAKNVLKFASLSDKKQGVSGSLYVSNFRVAFITTEDLGRGEVSRGQQNRVLGENDICLLNIDQVYQVVGDKKKKLNPGVSVFKKVKEVQIMCKNFRVHSFSFKFSPMDDGRIFTNALMHHAFPERHDRIFVFDYSEPPPPSLGGTRLFSSASDWMDELERTKCPGWRLSRANEAFRSFPYLPEAFVVPRSVVDQRMEDAALHFQGLRPPVWSWGCEKGAALVRMAHLHPGIPNSPHENVMLELVRKSHPTAQPPIILDLQVSLPSPKDVNNSFQKLKELCTPETVRHFWQQDGHFLSHLDATKWLQTVSSCLEVAAQVVHEITAKNASVVLQEGQACDMSTLVSSLAQLLLDPHFRSLKGFQSLIQKDWVALGHPFVDRLTRVRDKEAEQSPLFLLFLDCVWQLLQQFPTAFEFTETYLTTLWDSVHVSLFDTFLFNCEKDRKFARDDYRRPLPVRSVWEWTEQFSQQDMSLFYNPLYTITKQVQQLRGFSNGINQPAQTQNCSVLAHWPSSRVLKNVRYGASLELWQQCYLRWLPVLEIRSGGRPQEHFQEQLLVEEVVHLQRKVGQIEKGRFPSIPNAGGSAFKEASRLKLHQYETVNSFYPFNPGGVKDHRKAFFSNSIELLLQNSFLSELSDSQARFVDAEDF